MASQLNDVDKLRLLRGITKKVGDKPYENGYWGNHDRDYVLVELLDESGNLIEYKDIRKVNAIVGIDENFIKINPSSHLKLFGYNTGKFKIRYRFIRNLAGREDPVLLRTKTGFEKDIYPVLPDAGNIYITDDGKIYKGNEAEYIAQPDTAEQLLITNFKYNIETISPTRKEVRLSAKLIHDNQFGPFKYESDFLNLQESVKIQNINSSVGFMGNIVSATGGSAQSPPEFTYDYDNSDTIELIPNDGGFVFSPKMIGGTVKLTNAYLTGYKIQTVRTETNVIKNAQLEEIDIDDVTGQPRAINFGWDSSLHSDAVKLKNWNGGYFNVGGAWSGTSGIGYHAKFIRNEGRGGSACIKFIDQNDLYQDFDAWNQAPAHRLQMVYQTMNPLNQLGATAGDEVNVRLDMKSTIGGKGARIMLKYPTERFIENMPQNPPEGYFNPFAPPVAEAQPTEPPDGFVANTPENAWEVEAKPPRRQSQIIQAWDIDFFDGGEGETTADFSSLGYDGGVGAWIIYSTVPPVAGGEATYLWFPNLGPEYTKEGTLSEEEGWKWDGYAWVENESITNPSAPAGTVNPADYPEDNIVNGHPYQWSGQGNAVYKRKTFPGENKGWQTGCQAGSDGYFLFKDDLVWSNKKNRNEAGNLNVQTIEEWTQSNLLRNMQVVGQDGVTRTLYDDIFENGFIQSVTRAQKVDTCNVRSNHYIIFYHDGRGDADTSNKWFQMKLGNGDFLVGGGGDAAAEKYEVDFLKDISELINDQVNENNFKFELTFWRHEDSDRFRYYWAVGTDGGVTVHRSIDGDGDIRNDNFTVSGYPAPLTEKFDHIPSLPDAWFPRDATESNDHFRYDAVIGETVHQESATKTVEEVFFGAGRLATGGDDLIFGSRNPGAVNYNPLAIYDDGTSEFLFDPNPTKDGTVSSGKQYQWSGDEAVWNSIDAAIVYHYDTVSSDVLTTTAGGWNSFETSLTIPGNWSPVGEWFFRIYGNVAWGDSLTSETSHGILWVDNIFVDFTLNSQESSQPIYADFEANIVNIFNNGTRAKLDRSWSSAGDALVVENEDVEEYQTDSNPVNFDSFTISYLIYNPYDLRTYIKFGNRMFLTTNFRKDTTTLGYPYSVVYKLYEPLPANIERLDEVIVVKEMANAIEEDIEIIDFVDTEVGNVVLKSPDIMNVESPIQRKTLDYKTQTEILSEDGTVSTLLRNEFLSQSMDSAEINIDYSKFENFVNFSSIKKRIENFKYKLTQIETHTATSASYNGISGSSADVKIAMSSIDELKNNFDGFEKYMYFQSSSYVTSSLGRFFDNAWPKTSGTGTVGDEYVLASTNSTKAKTWYSEQITSASLYDNESFNKLSTILPQHIKFDTNNEDYINLVNMVGHHFDNIWLYIKAMGDIHDRREKLTEGMSKDLFMNVANSLGWQLNDGKDTISLSKYALGKEVTGSSFSNHSVQSERDTSREIWSRIVNNMPYFLKNKGSIRAIKGLISAYGIPSTILRVKEYGGPNLPDDASPQFEIGRKFTKSLDFRGSQSVMTLWSDDSSSGRKPDTIEFRFRTPTGSNMILVQKTPISPNASSSFYIRLKDNGSVDNYGHVSLQINGADGLKEITSSNLPVYDDDFYSVMVRRTSGSDNNNVSQSFELHVGKYDASRSKINLYSTSTLHTDIAASSSYNQNWENDGKIYIGGSAPNASVGARFSGSMMEYRQWTEVLSTGSFRNHIGNPKSYNGNSLSSSYENLVLRYSFDDNMDLSTDTDGIRDVSANSTNAYSGSHSGFTGNFFSSVVDETKSNVPSLGPLRRTSNKIRIESNPLKLGWNLDADHRSTVSAYDTAPNDSNKVGVYFAPTDVINTDIIESVANLNFDNYLGDPRDIQELEYRGLKSAADNYWRKYTSPNNFWDYIRLIKFYDQSLFGQIRQMIPARAKSNLGILVEPNIFERSKVIIGKTPKVEPLHYSASIDVNADFVEITSSYNHDNRYTITDFSAYDGRIDMYSYESGSSIVELSGSVPSFEGSASQFLDESYKLSLWQKLNQPGNFYATASITYGDSKYYEVLQPVITGSVIRGTNQKMMKFYSTPDSASVDNFHSTSFYDVDTDNMVDDSLAKLRSYYVGVKNTKLTTFDGGPPIEVTITSPTRLVKKTPGESSLDTGEGKVAKFKPKRRKKKKRSDFFKNRFGFGSKPAKNAQDAVSKAQQQKGDFLNKDELESVISKFNKSKNLRKNPFKKKKRKKK